MTTNSFDGFTFEERYKLNEIMNRSEFSCTEEEFNLLKKYILDLEDEAESAHERNDNLEDQIYELEEAQYTPYQEFLENLVHNWYNHSRKDYTTVEQVVLKAEHVLKYEEA